MVRRNVIRKRLVKLSNLQRGHQTDVWPLVSGTTERCRTSILNIIAIKPLWRASDSLKARTLELATSSYQHTRFYKGR